MLPTTFWGNQKQPLNDWGRCHPTKQPTRCLFCDSYRFARQDNLKSKKDGVKTPPPPRIPSYFQAPNPEKSPEKHIFESVTRWNPWLEDIPNYTNSRNHKANQLKMDRCLVKQPFGCFQKYGKTPKSSHV